MQTLYYGAIVAVNGIAYPCRSNASIAVPHNYQVPESLGSYYPWHYVEGLRQPVVALSFLVRDSSRSTQPSVLGAGFLSLFLNRVANAFGVPTEAPSAGDIVFWDGYRGFALHNSKADAFRISTSKGQDVTFTAQFCGTSLTALGANSGPGNVAGTAPTFNGWDRSPVINFASVSLDPWSSGLGLSGNYGFLGHADGRDYPLSASLTYSNNHQPNMSLNASHFPSECNAGVPVASMQVSCKTEDYCPSDGDSVYMYINGATTGLTFCMPYIINESDTNLQVPAPRVIRSYNLIGLGAGGSYLSTTFETGVGGDLLAGGPLNCNTSML